MNEKDQFSDHDKMAIAMQEFTKRLNEPPDPRELEPTPDGKAKTLPISFVEMTLDELFLGQWEVDQVHTQQIFNEVVGTGILTVWHPVTNRPIKRAGFGAVVITQDKDAAIADFNMTKKKNALDLTFPKLKAEIIKNAAQSLGKRFGRDINRKQVDTFKPPLRELDGKAFMALVERVEKGESMAAIQAESYFLLTDTQKEILQGAKTKQLAQ